MTASDSGICGMRRAKPLVLPRINNAPIWTMTGCSYYRWSRQSRSSAKQQITGLGSNRGIREEAVRSAVGTDEVIQEYPDDMPYPSRLVLGWDEEEPIHVVAAYDEQT